MLGIGVMCQFAVPAKGWKLLTWLVRRQVVFRKSSHPHGAAGVMPLRPADNHVYYHRGTILYSPRLYAHSKWRLSGSALRASSQTGCARGWPVAGTHISKP